MSLVAMEVEYDAFGDWVDETHIADPEAVGPEDWDEDTLEIVDEEATKPKDWLENKPSVVPDPEAEKPEDWDGEEVESSSIITKTAPWASLPAEIRLSVLGYVCLPMSGEQCNILDYPKVARFASVCLAWQAFFEAYTFRRLVLTTDSVGDFDAIIKRDDIRLAYIQKIWLRIDLPEYECPKCDETEDQPTFRCNNLIFSKCIKSLLGTLKFWHPARHGAQGVELMLSASSPSDTEHRIIRCEMKNNYPFHYAEDLDRVSSIIDFHRINIYEPISGLLHLNWFPPIYGEHVSRVQGTPLYLQPLNGKKGRFTSQAKNLPAVPMVKGLIMRRQFLRSIHMRTLSWLISRSFVALEWFRFEKTIALECHVQLYFDRGVKTHLLSSLPKTLRQLCFTQWEIPRKELRYVVRGLGTEISSDAQKYLPREMAKLSQRLEDLCPPWQMDTASFLKSIIEQSDPSKMVQSSLKRLSLRCSLSRPGRSRGEFIFLILLAAKAALSLPQLEILELWGVCRAEEESRAYIFRYCYEGRKPKIVWRSSAEAMGDQTQIIDQWSEVAEQQSDSTLAYDVTPLKETSRRIFRSRGTCIYRHLLLKTLMFDPITQIILENEPYDWNLDEESDASQKGSPPESDLDWNSAISDISMNSSIPDSDYESLQADIAALDHAHATFFQNHQW